jgi:hypothetical protein
MNTFVSVPHQQSMAQPGEGKHDLGRGYMTVLVVIDRIIKSITILTVVIRLIIQLDVDTL